MKTTNKKSDNRSYSPFSYSGSPVPPKGLRPDHNKKTGQLESAGERSFLLGFKPKDQLGAQRNIGPGSYIRTLRKNDGSSHNKTVIYDRSRNSSYEEIIANISVHDVPSSKNVSYYDENVESSSSIKNINSNGAPERAQEKGYKQNANFSMLGSNIENNVADTSLLIKKDLIQVKRDGKTLPLNSFSRGQNENSLGIVIQGLNKQKVEPTYFPVIKNIANTQKNKDEPKSEKLMFIEKTYSLSPYKRRTQKNSGMLDTSTQEVTQILKTNEAVIQRKKSSQQDHIYRIKGMNELKTAERPEKRLRSRGSQAQMNCEGSRTQNQSPRNYSSSKNNSFILLRKDQSSGATSIKAQGSSKRVNQLSQTGNSRDISPVPSLYKYQNRRLSEKIENNYRSDKLANVVSKKDNSSQETLHLSRQFKKSSQQELFVINTRCHTEEQDDAYEVKENADRGGLQSDCQERLNTASNQSTSQFQENEGFNSQINLSYYERTPRKSDEQEQRSEDVQSSTLESPQIKRAHLEPRNRETSPLIRQTSNENVLDEFAEKSMQVSIQDQSHSFAYSSVGKPQYDELLETSLISYLNEKDLVRERTRKEIELTLSMTKHPAFRRSKVIVPKNLNSTDKEHSSVQSTNITNSKSTNKNESIQFKQAKEEFFQPESSIEKDRTLEIDFNFADDVKVFGGKSNLLHDQVSPSFPGVINYRSSLIHKDLNIIKEESKIDNVNNNQDSSVLNSGSFPRLLKPDAGLNRNESGKASLKTFVSTNHKFHSPGDKLDDTLESGIIEQSFNENPMNSLNNDPSFSNLDKRNNPFVERELSFKYSSEFSP